MLKKSVCFRIFSKPVFDLVLERRRDENQTDKKKKRAGYDRQYQSEYTKNQQRRRNKAFKPAE